ncbi:MAG: archease [Thermoprotei archaeon]
MGEVSCGGYRFLEHTADAYFEASGKTLEEAFENAGKALFEVMLDTSRVECKTRKLVVDGGIDAYNAFYRWLEDLLIIFNVEKLAFTQFKVVFEKSLKTLSELNKPLRFLGEVCGENVDPEKHEIRKEVKAVTYSLMKITKENDCWYVSTVLDL